jgi:hypothetical protein
MTSDPTFPTTASEQPEMPERRQTVRVLNTEVREMRDMAEHGFTCSTIARAIGRDRGTVLKYCHDLLRRQDEVRRERQQMLAEYESAPRGLKGRVALKYGVSPNSIAALVCKTRKRLSYRSKNGRRGMGVACTAAEIAEMQRLRLTGLSCAVIAHRLSRSRMTVSTYTKGIDAPAVQRADLKRLRRIVAAADAAEMGDAEDLAARFGLANRHSFSATVYYARRMLAAYHTETKAA